MSFPQLCHDILTGLGLTTAEAFTIKGVPHAYRAKLVRKSSDGMFQSDDTQLGVFAQKPLTARQSAALSQAALAAEAKQVFLVLFGTADPDSVADLRAGLARENIHLSVFHQALANILAMDFGSLPEVFSFARLRQSLRGQVEDAPWRRHFQTVPIQPARVLPLHAADAATAEADLFRALQDGSFLLLGEPGAGKTTALLALGGELAAAGVQMPVFVPLGRYQGDFNALLGEILAEPPLSADMVSALLQSGGLTLLLDGLNEVQDPDLHAQLCAELNRYTDPAFSPSRWVVSGRVHDYQQSRHHLLHLESRRWEMQHLSADLVYRYLADSLGEADAKTLYDDLGSGVREICANPLLLSMLLEVYEQTGTAPASRSVLYREFIRLLLAWGRDSEQRQNLMQLLPALQSAADYARLTEDLLSALAAVMPATFIAWDSARQHLSTELRDCTNPLQAAALLLADWVQRGLLRHAHSANRLSFYHHTFQEYFRARTLTEETPETLIPDGGVPAERREAVVFVAGFLADPRPLLQRAMQVDLWLAYELLRSLPLKMTAESAQALAKQLWVSARGDGDFLGANRRYTVLFQRLAVVLDKSVEALAAELDWDLSREEQIESLASFYSELGDIQAQQRVLAQAGYDKEIPQALLFRVAQAAYDVGEYERSIKLYSQYLEYNPNDDAAWNNRGLAYDNWGKKSEAQADYQRAIELKGAAYQHCNFAILLHDLGKTDQAIAEAHLALQKDPAYANAYNWLANWQEEQDPETALTYREQAVRYAPHDEDLRQYCKNLAALQIKMSRHAPAIRTLRRMIELDPASSQVKDWKQRIAHLRQRQDAEERTHTARQRLLEQGELPLTTLAAEWLKAAGLQVTAATATELLAIGGRGLPDPLPVLLLPEPEITPAVLLDAMQALPKAARRATHIVLLSAADTLSLAARQQLAALQDTRQVALITAPEARDALLHSDRECRALLDNALRESQRDNPFEYKGVVRESTEFFGRSRELDILFDYLSRGQSPGLYGIHKIGKSSLLAQLRLKLHVSLPQLSVVQLELDSNLQHSHELYLRILEQLPEVAESLPPTNAVSARQFQQSLEQFQRRRERRYPDHRLLLILDEYAYLLPNHRGEGGLRDFIGALGLFKTLVQSGRFLLLPCGRTAALNRTASWGEDENPFVDLLHPVFLGPLPPEEHDVLLTSLGTRAGLAFAPESLPLLYTETGGHPGMTRDLGSQLLLDGKQPVTAQRVAEAVAHFLDNRDKTAILQAIYEKRLDADEQRLAETLALNGPQTRRDLVPAGAEREERRCIRDALDNLLDTFVLQKLEDGRIAHRYGLLRRYIEREA